MTTENQAAVNRPAAAGVRAAPVARAVTDGDIVLATLDVAAAPERVFRALTTDEAERWWGAPGVYTIDAWKADVRVGGAWSSASSVSRTAPRSPRAASSLQVDAPIEAGADAALRLGPSHARPPGDEGDLPAPADRELARASPCGTRISAARSRPTSTRGDGNASSIGSGAT